MKKEEEEEEEDETRPPCPRPVQLTLKKKSML